MMLSNRPYKLFTNFQSLYHYHYYYYYYYYFIRNLNSAMHRNEMRALLLFCFDQTFCMVASFVLSTAGPSQSCIPRHWPISVLVPRAACLKMFVHLSLALAQLIFAILFTANHIRVV